MPANAPALAAIKTAAAPPQPNSVVALPSKDSTRRLDGSIQATHTAADLDDCPQECDAIDMLLADVDLFPSSKVTVNLSVAQACGPARCGFAVTRPLDPAHPHTLLWLPGSIACSLMSDT
jgi:hypothetical protein